MSLDFIQKYPFILAFFFGLIPALVWLWFWLKEDTHPESARMITLSFLGGMTAVIFVLPLEQLVFDSIGSQNNLAFTIWAGIEEIFKFALVYFIALQNKNIADEPVDDIIYLIISALGFVTFENTLFLIDPVRTGNLVDTIVSGNLRFVGASLLHIVSSGTVGIFMGLSFYKSRGKKWLYLILGMLLAIALHTAFNLFIMSDARINIFLIFGFVWIGIIVLLLLFEKVKLVKNFQT